MTPNEFRTKRGLAGILNLAAEMAMPKREQIATPRLMSTAAAMKVPMAHGVVNPLAYAETENVEQSKNPEKSQRNEGGEIFIIDQPVMAWTEHVYGNADEVKHDRRHVEHVVGPVTPAGEKSVEVTENFFGPEIDAAFAGITVGEFDDSDALGKKKE